MGPDMSISDWKALIANPPTAKFFLIESVWQNFYHEGHSIKHQLPLLLDALKQKKIPIVFWNKEDPLHFNRFLPFALKSDLLLTSDRDCISRYYAAGFLGKIQCLPFPVQPKIHREYYPKDPNKKVFFAGRYTDQHSERIQTYENFLKPAIQSGLVDIFARKTRYVDESSWPEEAKFAIVGSLAYEELIREYTKYTIGLSISSVPNSVSMFPRRVVEMTMGNILVISDRNDALSHMFPEIPQATGGKSVVELIHYYLEHAEERQMIIKNTKKRILQNHTYQIAVKNICHSLKSRGTES